MDKDKEEIKCIEFTIFVMSKNSNFKYNEYFSC